MWYGHFDTTPQSLRSDREKLTDAMTFYFETFGEEPDVCLVRPATEDRLRNAGEKRVKLRASPFLPTGAFYVGKEDDRQDLTAEVHWSSAWAARPEPTRKASDDTG
jgi:hypothetical protein